jgi:protein arginine N-methyltransferase 1
MYSVHFYGQMLADAPRMDAYIAALCQAVRPGSVVLDLGSGPGLFALIACRQGARRVYAVEPDNVIQLAREAAIANGFADRIECFQELSTRLTLPEKADVIVSDLRGLLPWFQQHIPSVIDARTRLLAPGGVLIARRDKVWAAVVEVPDRYAELVAPWKRDRFDFDLSAATRVVTNSLRKAQLKPGELLTEPTCWATLDYYQVKSPDVRAQLDWRVARPGTAHGVSVWFDSELAEGITLTNRPGGPELIYGHALFPFSQPVDVLIGDQIQLSISADLVGEDYVWKWNTRIFAGSETEHLRADLRQSTFFGVPVSPAQLRKQEAGHVPILSQEGQVKKLILQSMDGATSLKEIALRLVELFPLRYADWEMALNDVSEVSRKFSR